MHPMWRPVERAREGRWRTPEVSEVRGEIPPRCDRPECRFLDAWRRGCVSRLEAGRLKSGAIPQFRRPGRSARRGSWRRRPAHGLRATSETPSTCRCWSTMARPSNRLGKVGDVASLFQDRPNSARERLGAAEAKARSPPLPDLRRRGPGRHVALLLLRPQPGDRPSRRPG